MKNPKTPLIVKFFLKSLPLFLLPIFFSCSNEPVDQSFKIVDQSIIKKGGKRYNLLRMKIILKDQSNGYDSDGLKKTFSTFLDKIIKKEINYVNGISIDLYQSKEHFASSGSRIAQAEWWPKGHSFSSDNGHNIENKSTYVKNVEILINLKKAEKILSRLTKKKRREIFYELVKAENKAMKAENKALDAVFNSLIKKKELIKKNQNIYEKHEKLRKKYEEKVLKKYKITPDEEELISNEAKNENWPLPSY